MVLPLEKILTPGPSPKTAKSAVFGEGCLTEKPVLREKGIPFSSFAALSKTGEGDTVRRNTIFRTEVTTCAEPRDEDGFVRSFLGNIKSTKVLLFNNNEE